MSKCGSYCGPACIDGSCPNAWREDNPEYFQDVYGTLKPLKCKDCSYNNGCEDCCIAFYEGITTEQCREDIKNFRKKGKGDLMSNAKNCKNKTNK